MRDGVVVLDSDLTVQSWNERSEELWGMRFAEVRGHSFLGLDIGLPMEQVRPLMRASLSNEDGDGSGPIELAATNRRGKAIRVRVSASPLWAPNDSRQGVILVMEEMRPNGGDQTHDGAQQPPN